MRNVVLVAVVLLMLISVRASAQLTDGTNDFRLAMVNPRLEGLNLSAGRGVVVATNPDLDSDGLPEILVTTYDDGGRVFVFEVTGDNQLEFVWASKKLTPGKRDPNSTTRSIITGDLDNNGRQEIIFQRGFETTEAVRGVYIYEHDGVVGSDNYGTEPVKHIKPEEIDPGFATTGYGRQEMALPATDIDGDGRAEIILCARQYAQFNIADAYIIQVTSGEWRLGNAAWKVEYEYTAMENAIPAEGDGYIPMGFGIGDVDGDGLDEIAIAGWQNFGVGSAIGFLQINGPDSYTPGSIVRLSDENYFNVKARPLYVTVNNSDVLFVMATGGATEDLDRKLLAFEGIIDDTIVDNTNVLTVLPDIKGKAFFNIWGYGDQDHGTGNDGFDFYMSNGNVRLTDFEYDGVGSIYEAGSYTEKEITNLDSLFSKRGGLINEIAVFPGMDLDGDGNREIVTSWKGSDLDSIAGVPVDTMGFHVFVYEWGDSSASINVRDSVLTSVAIGNWTLITPDDYSLEQNYPNPFNPGTSIDFVLPVSKKVSVRIYNMLGQEIRTLINQQDYPAGRHTAIWDGRDNAGRLVASGSYIYTLEFGNFRKSRTMTLLK